MFKIRKKALQFLPIIWAPNHPNPSPQDWMHTYETMYCNIWSIHFGVPSWVFHSYQFPWMLQGKTYRNPMFFSPLSSSGTVFPIHEAHMFMALLVHFANNTHTPSLEFLRIQIPERNKIHQDPWDIPYQPLIRTTFFCELTRQNMVSEGPTADSQGLEGANSQPSLDLWLLLPSFDSCQLESRKPS